MADAEIPQTKTLAQAVRDRDKALAPIFEAPFSAPDRWIAYLETRLGSPPKASQILGKQAPLTLEDFQALYVACWIHTPVEKGTFMIPLTPQQRGQVRAGYMNLGVRWTSHLNGHGRSAGKNWAFLRGYSELLVQLVGGGKSAPDKPPFLFLKCEGAASVSKQHIEGWRKKTYGDGAGETCNEELKALGEQGAFGIQSRRAENFNRTRYAVLLEHLDLVETTTTVQQMTACLLATCRDFCATRAIPEFEAFEPLVRALGLEPDADAGDFAVMPSAKIAQVIEVVLLPLMGTAATSKVSDPQLAALAEVVMRAELSLRELCRRLREDILVSGQAAAPRYYQEVIVDAPNLDESLAAFVRELDPSRANKQA